MSDAGWHIVGGRGRGRSGRGTQGAHLQSGKEVAVPSRDVLRIDGAASPITLPGWGTSDCRSRPSTSRQRKRRQERTPEEKADALVTAVQEAQRELLLSPFWQGLLRCFASAEEVLSTSVTATDDQKTAAAQESTATAEGALVAANEEGATTCNGSGATARASSGPSREPAACADSITAVAYTAAAATATNTTAAAAADPEATIMPAPSPLASYGGKDAISVITSPEAEQQHRCTSFVHVVESVLRPSVEKSLNEDAIPGHSPRKCWRSKAEQLPGDCGSSSRTQLRRGLGQGLGHWRDVQQLLVFGLGSLESGAVPRHQAALALLLMTLLPGMLGPPQAYDPVFTAIDCAALTSLGFQVLSLEAAEVKRVEVQTLLYLPHCESEFTASAMRTFAAEPACLASTAVIGNSFEASHDRWCRGSAAHSDNERCPAAAVEAAPSTRLTEITVSERGYDVTGAFNDMSLHVFSSTVAD